MHPQREDSPREFLARAGNALLRVPVLAIFGACHWALDQGTKYIVPANLPSGRLWLEDVSFCLFSLIYVYLLWDALKVFIPRLHLKAYPGQEVNDHDNPKKFG